MKIKKYAVICIGLLCFALAGCPPIPLGEMTLDINIPKDGIIRLSETREDTIRWTLFIQGGVPATSDAYPRNYSLYLYKGDEQIEVIAENIKECQSFVWKGIDVPTGDDYRYCIKTQDYSDYTWHQEFSDYFKIDNWNWKQVKTYDNEFPLLSAGIKIQDENGNKLLVGYREVTDKGVNDTKRYLKLHSLEGSEEIDGTQFPEKNVNAYCFDHYNETDYVFYSGNLEDGSYLVKGADFDNNSSEIENYDESMVSLENNNIQYCFGLSMASWPTNQSTFMSYFYVNTIEKNITEIRITKYNNSYNTTIGVSQISELSPLLLPSISAGLKNNNCFYSVLNTSMMVNSNGSPYIAIPIIDSEKQTKIYVYTQYDSNWASLTSNSSGASPVNTDNANYPSLICDPDDNPVILYSTENNNLVVKRWGGTSWTSLDYPARNPVTFKEVKWGSIKIIDQLPAITTAGKYLVAASSHGIMAYNTDLDNKQWIDLGYPNAPSGGMGKVSQWVDGNENTIAVAFIDERGDVQVWKLDISGGIK